MVDAAIGGKTGVDLGVRGAGELLGLEVMLAGRPALAVEEDRVRGEVGEFAVGFVDRVEVDDGGHGRGG